MRKKKSKALNYADDAPLTRAELHTARPIGEVFPEIVSTYRRGKLKRRGKSDTADH